MTVGCKPTTTGVAAHSVVHDHCCPVGQQLRCCTTRFARGAAALRQWARQRLAMAARELLNQYSPSRGSLELLAQREPQGYAGLTSARSAKGPGQGKVMQA